MVITAELACSINRIIQLSLLALVFGLPALAAKPDDPVPKFAGAWDIRHALDRAEAIHPELYWNSDREIIDRQATELTRALPDPVSRHDVYLTLLTIFGLLGDGHVTVDRPLADDGNDTLKRAFSNDLAPLLAVQVEPNKEGLKVITVAARGLGLQPGDVINSINGVDALEWWSRILAIIPGEPGFKLLHAEEGFAVHLWDLGARAPFDLVVDRHHGGSHVATVGARNSDYYPSPKQVGNAAGIDYELLPDRVALLRFRHMRAPTDRFAGRLAEVFSRLAADEPVGLIVDLRQNGGGNSGLGEELLTYLTDKPRRPFARKTIRTSRECREEFDRNYPDSPDARVMRDLADGERWHWDVPDMTIPRKANAFQGRSAFLIGPGTFSSTNILANEIADYQLATLIGQATAEMPNNYGEPCSVTLPNTGIVLHVPGAGFVRANGDAVNREDVLPDIPVDESAHGYQQDTDRTLEAALAWIHAVDR